MNVSFRQVYLKPGISFPFSHLMQIRLSAEVSALVEASPAFLSKFGPDWELVVNVSAETTTDANVLKGPAVFKRAREVEYTVLLPYDAVPRNAGGCRKALELLIEGIRSVLERLDLDTQQFEAKAPSIVEAIASDPTMLTHPWPDHSAQLH
ncbi:MAG: hypothetical protein IPG45_03220 [Deltaproteobacteria bacterium]|nr:hypothetical protein [Deltaproteobacteria bacterium]